MPAGLLRSGKGEIAAAGLDVETYLLAVFRGIALQFVIEVGLDVFRTATEAGQIEGP